MAGPLRRGAGAGLGVPGPAVGLLVMPANLMTAPNGLKSWNLTFVSDDTVSATATVRVTAEPVSVPPCNFGVTPAMVKFPMLEPGAMAVSNAPVQVCNLAPGAATGERCLVHSFQLTGAGFSAPMFFIVTKRRRSMVSIEETSTLILSPTLIFVPSGSSTSCCETRASTPSRSRTNTP